MYKKIKEFFNSRKEARLELTTIRIQNKYRAETFSDFLKSI